MEICPDCISGRNNCIEPDCYKIQGECNGVIAAEHNSVTNTIEYCIKLCKTTPSCKWFTFNKELSLCSLFESCLHMDSSCKTCISGERSCGDTTRLSSSATEILNTTAPTRAATTTASTATPTVASTLTTTNAISNFKITPKPQQGNTNFSLNYQLPYQNLTIFELHFS
jgi:hypothetical protein